MFRLPFSPPEGLRRVPVVGPALNDAERRRDYEDLFFGSELGMRVLADMLRSHGVFSPSFTGQGFDPIRAAHNDGAKTALLEIFRTAGGTPERLARAVTLNSMEETRDEW